MHGNEAFGARFLKEGFSFGAEDDLAWALGFPHLRTLTDEPDEFLERWTLGYPRSEEYSARVPRATAVGLARAFQFVPSSKTAFRSWPKRAKAFLEDDAPITAELAHAIITSHVRMEAIEKRYTPQTFPAFIYHLEALVGPEPVAWALLDALKALEPSDFCQDAPTLYEIVGTLGFLRLRMRTPHAEKLTGELRALLDAVVSTLRGKKLGELKSAQDGGRPYRMLDLILNGGEAVLRSADGARRFAPAGRLVFAGDGPDLIVEQLGKATMVIGPPVPRLVFLAGEAVYEYEHRVFQEYDEPDLRERLLIMLDTYGRIRMPSTVALLLRVALLDEAYDETMQWFREHPVYSRDVCLELVAQRTPEARIAEQMLELLDEWAATAEE